MPRKARLDAPGTLHHVIARGIERRKIFLAQADCEEFVARLEKAITRGKAQLLAWASHFEPPHLTILVHGELQAALTLERLLEEKLRFNVVVAEPDEIFELDGRRDRGS
jgi:hypothetical protein